MSASFTHAVLPWQQAPPVEVMRAWPESWPLLALHSGRFHPQWARYTVLSTPSGYLQIDPSGRGRRVGVDGHAVALPAADPLQTLRRAVRESRADGAVAVIPDVPFCTGWLGYLSYELGRLLEPAATLRRGAVEASRLMSEGGGRWPVAELARCDGALVYDALWHRWTATGAWRRALPPGLQAALQRVGSPSSEGGDYRLGDLQSRIGRPEHEAAVARAVEYIRAGDVFQANITRDLHTTFRGSSRALFLRAAAESPAWYSAYLELPGGRCLLSLSPELFLQVEPGGQVATRPVKGTRPASATAAELLASEKDAAELNMIIDLCRNDLGRVCELGSVRVSQPRCVETHPTVHHGVATIEGRLASGRDVFDLLQASFPGGSVTGAPKIRAMQIIEELEGRPRGPYCGSIGWLADDGAARLNIAIRTMTLTERRARKDSVRYSTGQFADAEAVYGVGGGIVADSEPVPEFEETEAKAAVLERLVGGHRQQPPAMASDSIGSGEFACPPADLPL